MELGRIDVLGDDWHRVCEVADLGDEEVMQHWVGDVPLAVYRIEGEFYATSDLCSHQGANLSEGFIENDQIECPLHQGCYDIPTGGVRRGPACEDLPVYPVRTQDGWVFVQYVEDLE